MKGWKDALQGIGGALYIAAPLAWNYLKKLWRNRSETQKSVLLAVLIAVVALGFSQCVRAENNPNSNFGGFNSEDGSTVYMCYTATANEVKVGTIYTCLIMFPVAPGILGARGQVSYCTITNYVEDKPYVSCGKYADMKRVAGGV